MRDIRWSSSFMPAVQMKFLLDELIGLGERAEHLIKHTELDIHRVREFKDVDNYETELTQVAAVAIAAITDIRMQRNLDAGRSVSKDDVESDIIADIMTERDRQDIQFNRPIYPYNQDPAIWVLVLMAELREVAQEFVEPDVY
ncbi:MAG TPA: hypothetical protein VIQ31_26350 [Phormidium sp.]